jgi:carboxypeptidase Q
MKIMRLILTLSILFSAVSFNSAQQDKVIKSIIQLGQTDNQTMNHLDVLTNRFGGRPIGSDAYDNAADWCSVQFKKWGMEVQIDQCGTLPVGFNRGAWFGRMLSEDGMTLHFATPSYTAGTKGVQRGHVLIEPKTQADFDRMKGVLKGSWVLISGTNTGWPIDWSVKGDSVRAKVIADNEEIAKKNNEIRMENRKNPDKEPVKELPLKEEPALFYKQMREAGILGIIQSSTVPIRALYDRKNIENMTFETLPTIPDIKLDDHQYAVIEQMVK